jgi:DeoR family fructose operon transcriptional repressor
MIASERAVYIINRLRERDIVSLKDIARELNISDATVRRDFEKLEKGGILLRVHSGASRITEEETGQVGQTGTIPVVVRKVDKNAAAKHAVAKRAAVLVEDGDCIFLDGGTSLAPIIHYLEGKKIKIVTHNIRIAWNLADMGIDLFLVGGLYKLDHATTVGHVAEDMISQFHFDHAFFGCSGIDLNKGVVYNNEFDTIPVKETALRCSAHNHLLIDESKINVSAFCLFTKLNCFENVFCNAKEGITEYPENFIIV